MVSRGLFGWSPPHVQPLTPVSETSEPPESPSPYAADFAHGADAAAPPPDDDAHPPLDDAEDDPDPPPAAVPFKRLFACADRLDWALMAAGSLAAAAHGVALVVYLHLFGRAINTLHGRHTHDLFHNINQHALYFLYIAVGVFFAAWIEVSCWILTGERQTASGPQRRLAHSICSEREGWELHSQHGYVFWWSYHWLGQLLADSSVDISNWTLHCCCRRNIKHFPPQAC